MLTVDYSFLNQVEQYCQDWVKPNAATIDQDSDALFQALRGMGDRSLLALRIPTQWGGRGLDELTYRHFQMLITRYSGVLAFLQTQHQSAGSQLAKSPNESLKKTYLPTLGTGENLIGVGYSHLRRRDHPPLKAIPQKEGYLLTGTVPWITGGNLFNWVIVGAVLPSEEALYSLIPFQDTEQQSGGTIRFSSPMALAAMQTSNTVSATLNHWLISPEQVVNILPLSQLEQKDHQTVLHHGFYALGCAQASLDIVQTLSDRPNRSFLKDTYLSLHSDVQSCCQQMLSADSSISYEQRLSLRTHAIGLAGRCSQAAVIAASGAANSLNHPAQRVYREALMFSVFGQTIDVMKGTLRQLH